MSIKDGLNHIRLRDKLASPLHHDHTGPVSRHYDIDIAHLLLAKGGIGDQLTINSANTNAGNGPIKGNIRYFEGR